MNPLRLAILNRTLEPRSSTAVAAELGLPRQKVNYHVRELARHAFLRTPAAGAGATSTSSAGGPPLAPT